MFLFLSLLFEVIDILVGLMENLFEPWCHNGYKDVIYGVSNHKTFDTKAYRWGESWLIYFNCLNDVLWLLVLCYLSSSRCLCLACNVWMWYFLIILTYFCCFWSSFTPGKQVGKPGADVQCRKSRYWNKASPWNWWCDCKILFWQMCRKKWICIFPL